MVIPVGPGKFYGSSLPRPRYFTNVTFNSERIDPPVPVLDPLLSWANEAHWSMGGLSFKRLRLQGRIEGNVNKLRVEREKIAKKQLRSDSSDDVFVFDGEAETKSEIARKRPASVSPPPAPIATKRRRFMAPVDEEEEIEEVRRKPVRKLGDDFDRVASENTVEESERANRIDRSVPVKGSGSGSIRTRSRRSEPEAVAEVVQEVKGKSLKSGKKGKATESTRSSPVSSIRSTRSSPASSTRSSPRLGKRGST